MTHPHMNHLVHVALVDYLVHKQSLERKPHRELYVSDLGQHPYKAMSRIMGIERPGFDDETLVKMQSGNALEDDTIQALQWAYGKVSTQVPLFNEYWSGYADAVLNHLSNEAVIIEHKAVGDQWFDYKESLPRSSHVCQTWLYQQIYNERFGIYPRAIIYYRAWGQWAEFEITENADGTPLATGFVKKDKSLAAAVSRKIACLPHLLRAEMEDCFTNGEIPPADGADSWTYGEDHYVRWMESQRAAARQGGAA